MLIAARTSQRSLLGARRGTSSRTRPAWRPFFSPAIGRKSISSRKDGGGLAANERQPSRPPHVCMLADRRGTGRRGRLRRRVQGASRPRARLPRAPLPPFSSSRAATATSSAPSLETPPLRRTSGHDRPSRRAPRRERSRPPRTGFPCSGGRGEWTSQTRVGAVQAPPPHGPRGLSSPRSPSSREREDRLSQSRRRISFAEPDGEDAGARPYTSTEAGSLSPFDPASPPTHSSSARPRVPARRGRGAGLGRPSGPPASVKRLADQLSGRPCLHRGDRPRGSLSERSTGRRGAGLDRGTCVRVEHMFPCWPVCSSRVSS